MGRSRCDARKDQVRDGGELKTAVEDAILQQFDFEGAKNGHGAGAPKFAAVGFFDAVGGKAAQRGRMVHQGHRGTRWGRNHGCILSKTYERCLVLWCSSGARST